MEINVFQIGSLHDTDLNKELNNFFKNFNTNFQNSVLVIPSVPLGQKFQAITGQQSDSRGACFGFGIHEYQ